MASSRGQARGSVVRVKLNNFLTYDDLEVRPAPGLNLLIGPNGSGKSTIICALCIGLAGAPQILGRSTNYRDYIKHGKNSATVEIELCTGSEARNPVIKTVIFWRGGNEHYINDCKKSRDEVRAFVQGYHIQLDNLCQFLAQDRVVEFARQSKHELLLNTEKAAGTVDLFDQHTKLKDSYAEGTELRKQLAAIGEKKTMLQQKLDTLEKPFKQFEEYEKRREKVDLLEKKRPWVEYELLKIEAATVKTQLDRVKREYSEREAHLKPLRDEIATAKAQVRRADTEIDNQKRRIDHTRTRIVTDLDSLNRVVDEMETITSNLQTVRQDYESKNKRIQTMEASLATLCQQLDDLRDEDMQPLMKAKDREINETSRTLDELDPQKRDAERNLRAEQGRVAGFTQELSSLQNRQHQQLQCVRRFDENAYNAYNWYLNNKHLFRGAVWLPAVDIRVPDPKNIKFIEACIGKRDLFAFIFESFEDLQHFLNETKKQNIRVGGGEVPEGRVDTNTRLPDDMRRLGFRDFVCNMFEAPDGLKKYLTKLSSLNRIPVGTEETERNLERVTSTVKGRYHMFLTPNKRLTISESRYGGGTTVLNQALGDPHFLPHTIGNNDESQHDGLNQQLNRSKAEVQRFQTLLNHLEETIREVNRRWEVLKGEKNQLRQRAGQRPALNQQITYKRDHLQQMQTALPDISREEQRCEEQLKAKFASKLTLAQRAADFAETIEGVCGELANSCVVRAAFSATALSRQRELNAASAELNQFKEQRDKLQVEYGEKKEHETVMLERARRGIGLQPEGRQPIPDNIREAFETLPKDLEGLDEQIEDQRARLEQAQGFDRSIANEYKARQADFNKTTMQETQLQQSVNTWETEAGVKRDKWLTELQQLIEIISRNFSRFMVVLDCAGEVELDTPEDVNNFTAYGVKIKVKFRDNEPLRELNPQHQSGGERSVATMLYMLALQELSHVPFRCVDEINQGMDPVNERKVFEMMTKLLGGNDGVLNCTQYFMLTPKLLHGLPMGDNIEVWLIHNGPRMMRHHQWAVESFIKRKQALNAYETAMA